MSADWNRVFWVCCVGFWAFMLCSALGRIADRLPTSVTVNNYIPAAPSGCDCDEETLTCQ